MKIELTEKEQQAIISEMKKLSLAIISITMILEGASQGYYGGKEEDDGK